ncbi:sel1 repeat family protein [Marinobacter flavimaris]|uniref:Sel1 repeat family protein n=1 Tax=Marinobacter flavimaris TaxID=262076 RepID=A0A3D8H989_9GAMM|nr:hypothetical protein MDHKLMBL_20330 [Marinobacter flavimaris]RDU42951.1 sel1 repeat family protein [Marinobacter flavimaris]
MQITVNRKVRDGDRAKSQDCEQAANWYRKSAEQGQTDARFNLRVMHDKSQSVLQMTFRPISSPVWPLINVEILMPEGFMTLQNRENDQGSGCQTAETSSRAGV